MIIRQTLENDNRGKVFDSDRERKREPLWQDTQVTNAKHAQIKHI